MCNVTSLGVSNALRQKRADVLVPFGHGHLILRAQDVLVVVVRPAAEPIADHGELLELLAGLIAALVQIDVDALVELQRNKAISTLTFLASLTPSLHQPQKLTSASAASWTLGNNSGKAAHKAR